MLNFEWSKYDLTTNRLKLGRFGEYYAKAVLASHGMYIYSSEVDDHGIDFLAENSSGNLLKFQVKTVCKNNYVFCREKVFNIKDNSLYLILIVLRNDNETPEMYIIPTSAWNCSDGVFVYRKYKNPEYGINNSKRNRPKLEKYKIENMIDSIL